MDKLVKDGMAAILYSPGYGAGWSTWGNPWLATDKRLAECVEAGSDGLAELAEKIGLDDYNEEYVCTLGAKDVKIMWLPVGTAYKINEYDGHESVETVQDEWPRA